MMKNMQMTALASAAFPKESDAIRLLESMRSASPEESSKAVDDVTVLVESSVLVDADASKDVDYHEILKDLKDDELNFKNEKVQAAVIQAANNQAKKLRQQGLRVTFLDKATAADCGPSVKKEKMKRFLARLAELDLAKLDLENLVPANKENGDFHTMNEKIIAIVFTLPLTDNENKMIAKVKAIVETLRLTDTFTDEMIAQGVEKKWLEKKIEALELTKKDIESELIAFKAKLAFLKWNEQQAAYDFEYDQGGDAARDARSPIAEAAKNAARQPMLDLSTEAVGDYFHDSRSLDMTKAILKACGHDVKDHAKDDTPSSLVLKATPDLEKLEGVKSILEAFVIAEAKEAKTQWEAKKKNPLVKLCRVAQQCLECKSYDKDTWRKCLVIETIGKVWDPQCKAGENFKNRSALVVWAAMSSPAILEACLIVIPNISEHLIFSLCLAAKTDEQNIELLLRKVKVADVQKTLKEAVGSCDHYIARDKLEKRLNELPAEKPMSSAANF